MLPINWTSRPCPALLGADPLPDQLPPFPDPFLSFSPQAARSLQDFPQSLKSHGGEMEWVGGGLREGELKSKGMTMIPLPSYLQKSHPRPCCHKCRCTRQQ